MSVYVGRGAQLYLCTLGCGGDRPLEMCMWGGVPNYTCVRWGVVGIDH